MKDCKRVRRNLGSLGKDKATSNTLETGTNWTFFLVNPCVLCITNVQDREKSSRYFANRPAASPERQRGDFTECPAL